jgi:transcription elongation factor GreA
MNTFIDTTTERKTILLSKKGMKEIRKEIQQLEADRRQIILELRELDRESGHDERLARIEKLSRLETTESELFEKRHIVQHAKLLPSRSARMKVALGSVVDLIDQHGRLMQYTLVDSIEANPSDGRISVVSPLGQSLLGKSASEKVSWQSGQKTHNLQLVGIR